MSMQNGLVGLLHEEVRELERLRELLCAERERVAAMDRGGLLALVRQKEALAVRLEALLSRKAEREAAGEGGASDHPEVERLVAKRKHLLRVMREEGRMQRRILEEQGARVARLLDFLRSLRGPASTYNRSGRLQQG